MPIFPREIVKALDDAALRKKRTVLQHLVECLDEGGPHIFHKLYPKGPTDKQLDHAIFQCECTLRNRGKNGAVSKNNT